MITKGQWKELCDKIRDKRKEGKDIYFGNDSLKIEACFQYRDFILLTGWPEIKLRHIDFVKLSYKQVKSQFYWTEIHNFNEEEK